MDKYAVVGNPIKHSLSPSIHCLFAEQTKQNIRYEILEPEKSDFAKTVDAFRKNGGKGMNVSLPFKPEAFQMSDEQSDLAKQAQAANVLWFKPNGKIYADNADGPGLVQDITRNHDFCLRQKRILLLGAGGAAQTVLGSLLEQAPASLDIANRTAVRATELAKRYELMGNVHGIALTDIEASPYDLIINTTSAGYTGKALELPTGIISAQTVCYDMMYGKQGNPFLEWVKRSGATRCIDGLGMLVEQAAISFYLWRGVYPDTKAVIEALRH